MTAPLTIEVVRGGIVESVHEADVAIVDAAGSLVDSAGEPLRVAAFRSSAKPLQAGVLLEAGWSPPSEACLAVACASHNGEPRHVAAVDEILRAAGLDRTALRCPPSLPAAHLPEVVATSGGAAAVYHNCSGKHAAMLATCDARGWPLESYREPDHPLQLAIHEAIEAATGALLETAKDGCGVVTFAAPLAVLARGFGALRDEPYARAAAAMRAQPFLVAGTGRICTDTMTALPGVVVKIGAEGMVCATAGEVSVCLKVRDGSDRARGPALFEALRRADLLPDALPPTLEAHARPPVTGGGTTVGEVRLRL